MVWTAALAGTRQLWIRDTADAGSCFFGLARRTLVVVESSALFSVAMLAGSAGGSFSGGAPVKPAFMLAAPGSGHACLFCLHAFPLFDGARRPPYGHHIAEQQYC